MHHSSHVFKVGTRSSNLAIIQTRHAMECLQASAPGIAFEMVPVSSPGDRDRNTDLRDSPPDFFTRDLDQAILGNTLDCAVHSAKDLPDPMPDGLDWFWLPGHADSRDVLVLRTGMAVTSLPAQPVAGISSDRRSAYVQRRFPGARLQSIRGTIEDRLRQLDEGRYDILIMAAAALERLGLANRVTEWIPVTELPPPEGQGYLAVTYRKGDARLNRLRSLFTYAVRFVSAGVGTVMHCTLAGRQALEWADTCLYDTLMDPHLLTFLPESAQRIDVGKRCGDHRVPQETITRIMLDQVRRGRRVVRLKGGDAGLFGRLAEELESLDQHELPYAVLPGVSSLTAATTGTGLLLTRRGVSRGFCALTPRGAGGGVEPFDAAARAALPIVFFMALRMAGEISRTLQDEGSSPDTPAAVVLDAGSESERVIRTTLAGLAEAVGTASAEAAGLLIVGDVCRYGERRRAGALRGARVLLTCSEELLDRAAMAVTDAGGIPLRMPLLHMVPRSDAVDTLRDLSRFDWVVLTSPSAARCFLKAIDAAGADLRRVPRLMACGPGTAAVLQSARMTPDLVPETDFSSQGLLQAARGVLLPRQRVLRLRSSKAGPGMAEDLATFGVAVTDCVLYENEPVPYDACPACDIVFFASASAVEYFVAQGFEKSLKGTVVLAIGGPTARALENAGVKVDVRGEPATVAGAITSLARYTVAKEFET
ncbi:MAG: hydroxymethylbilane synthase [Lentisphaerae bacterium RIFOXYC12_FULL_60_16]|nr:MAG: hydroxymethylbilane synthase [Lentisphaerae bacterium RIFOXYC12_FULL_60_16]